jgi:hypothetical protein
MPQTGKMVNKTLLWPAHRTSADAAAAAAAATATAAAHHRGAMPGEHAQLRHVVRRDDVHRAAVARRHKHQLTVREQRPRERVELHRVLRFAAADRVHGGLRHVAAVFIEEVQRHLQPRRARVAQCCCLARSRRARQCAIVRRSDAVWRRRGLAQRAHALATSSLRSVWCNDRTSAPPATASRCSCCWKGQNAAAYTGPCDCARCSCVDRHCMIPLPALAGLPLAPACCLVAAASGSGVTS